MLYSKDCSLLSLNHFCTYMYIYIATLFMEIVLLYTGNRQKKAKAMIEASGLKMIAVEDFDMAARTVCFVVFFTCDSRIFVGQYMYFAFINYCV